MGQISSAALPSILGAVNALAANQRQLKSAKDEFFAATENLAAAIPLEVYTLGLTDVIEARLDNARPVGWRYLLLQTICPSPRLKWRLRAIRSKSDFRVSTAGVSRKCPKCSENNHIKC